MNSIVCGPQFYLANLETAYACRNLEPGGNRGMAERRPRIFSCVPKEENPEIRERFSDNSAAASNFHLSRDSKSRANPHG
jgi:hypothetical protein